MTPVFGRDEELALADGFLDAAEERFSVLLLEGTPGIGKTTVWREVARRAEERGFRVLSSRPAETEAKLSLAAVADLFEAIPTAAFAGLPEPQRRGLDVALRRIDPKAASLDQRTVATAVRSILAALSAKRPLLVAIDDVQWLDPSSASVLEFALRRLTATRIGWVFTHRLSVPARLADDAHVPPESLTRHMLGPLPLASLHRLLDDRLGQPFARPMLVRIHEASGGNPLFALEIARHLDALDARRPGAPLPVPMNLLELVADRIAKLSTSAREALLVAATLSQPTVEVVEHASSPAALAAAEETGLARVDDGRVVFAHPLYASAVYDSASTRRRRELHRRLVDLVDDSEQRARHLALSVEGPDERVAHELEDAAGLARSRGAWEAAADLLERAAQLTPPERAEDGQRRRITAAEHHIHAGDRPRARLLLEQLVDEPLPRAVRAEALRLLAEHHIHVEPFAEIVRLLREALEYADEPRHAASIELALGFAYTFWDPYRGVPHAYRALERAEGIGERPLLAAALALCASLDFLSGRGVDWAKIERALALEDPQSVMSLQWRPSLLAAFLQLWTGRLSEARERLTALRKSMSESGDESNLDLILLWLSAVETRSANFAAAAEFAEEIAYYATVTGSQSFLAFASAQRACVRAHRGEIEETRRDCAEAAAVADRIGHTFPYVFIAAALTLLELSLGNPAAGWAACEAITVGLEEDGIRDPSMPFFLPDALQALIVLGQLDRAEALLDAFEGRGRELDRPWVLATGGRCRGLLFAARGDLAGATAALEQALREHQRLEMPFELARTLLVKGVVERRARRRAQARQALEQAFEIFERVGAPLWAERTREEIARLGLHRAGRGELTAGERRVAELAARGLTNREVAAELFVSPKTVDANLSRVYRKLGISSRAELGARMGEKRQT